MCFDPQRKFLLKTPAGIAKICTARSLDVIIALFARLTYGRSSGSLYLKSIYTLRKDAFVHHDAEVTGKIPSDFRGMILTMVPNSVYLPDGGYHFSKVMVR